jgi:hypothetical protein
MLFTCNYETANLVLTLKAGGVMSFYALQSRYQRKIVAASLVKDYDIPVFE